MVKSFVSPGLARRSLSCSQAPEGGVQADFEALGANYHMRNAELSAGALGPPGPKDCPGVL